MRIASRLDRGSETVVVTHVGGMAGRDATDFPDFFRRRIQLLLRAPDQRDRGSVLGEPPGDREVDSTSATGNDRGLSGQQHGSEHVRHQCSD